MNSSEYGMKGAGFGAMKTGEYRDIFIERLKSIYGNALDYSDVDYTNRHTKAKLVCQKHGVFYKTPDELYKGRGCPKCGHARSGRRNDDTEKFLKKVKDRFGGCQDVDLSFVNYTSSRERVEIVCKKHGHIWRSPSNILSSNFICPICGREYSAELAEKKHAEAIAKKPPRISKNKQRAVHDLESFIRKAREVHGNRYNYSKVNYINSQTKVTVICPAHGEFEVKPNKHISGAGNGRKGTGCPMCNASHLEIEVRMYLQKIGIKFVEQKRFPWLGKQSIDFYIPSRRIAIECQGEQHYRPLKFFGGMNGLKRRIGRDQKKRELCKLHKIRMLYYDDFGWLDNDYQRLITNPF